MNKSEGISNLATALCQFQSEVTNPKNSANNPYFKSRYAPLNDVLNLVRPILSKNGLSVFQSPSGDGDNIIITTMLLHSSGEWIEADPLILKADKATAQGAGSAITYGRRYAISAILGISSEDDDDGNHATGNKEGQSEQEKSKIEPSKQDSQPESAVDTHYCEGDSCKGKNKVITDKIAKFSKGKYGKELCYSCQEAAKKREAV